MTKINLMSEIVVSKVMSRIESFYYEDGPDSGEVVFNTFAKNYEHLFEEDFDATSGENKLEFTPIYKEFCLLFESCIESN